MIFPSRFHQSSVRMKKAVELGRVIVASQDGTVTALDRRKGQVVWQVRDGVPPPAELPEFPASWQTDYAAMAALANTGDRSTPRNGYRTPAAMGMPRTL